MLRKSPLVALSALFAAAAQAAAPPQVPNAGSILQENQPPQSPSATRNRAEVLSELIAANGKS